MKRNLLSFTLLGAFMLSSCSSSKTGLPYFTDIDKIEAVSVEAGDYLSKIKPDDELLITVNTFDPTASAPFNMAMINPGNVLIQTDAATPISVLSSGTQLQTYFVNSEGDINFPVLGQLHVAGLNVEQVQKMLTERLTEYLENPIVTVRLANFNVVVAGEVLKPSKILVNRNRYSILDAISDAGDLTPYGRRDNVLLVRERDGKREFHRLDLSSSDLLTSPYFYLEQNDYVYVEPSKVREDNAKYNQNNSFKLSVISTIVSATSVLASLIIALAVK